MSASAVPADGQITTTPTSGRPWRLAVVGIVAVLAVGIGGALGAFLLDSRAGGVGSAAAYVPADAPIYLELRLEPSDDQDAALRNLLGRFPPIEGVDLTRPLSEALAQALDDALANGRAEVSWSRDVEPWFDGRVALAVTEAAFATPPTTDPATGPDDIPAVVLLGVSDRSAAAESIERLLARWNPSLQFTDAAHGGFTIRSAAEGFGAYVLTDDQLLLAATADALREALDARSSGATLAQSVERGRLVARLPSDWLALAVYDLSGLMADALSQMGTESPEMAAAFEALYRDQPTRMAFTLSATADGLAVDAISDAPTGEMAVVNADRGLADEVPADALYYSEGGNLGPVLAALVDAMKPALRADAAVAEQVGTVEAALGAELEDLLRWIGDGATVIGWDGTAPYGGLVLVPTDAADAARRLGQLRSFAELAALDPTSGLAVSEQQVGSVTVTTIRWVPADAGASAPFMGPSRVVVEYALTDDRVLVGIGDTFVRRALDLDPSDALAADPRYAGAVADLGGSPNTGVAWLDLAGTREAVEEALASEMAGMDPEGTYDADVRPWLLPLDRLVSVGRLDGDVVETRVVLFIE